MATPSVTIVVVIRERFGHARRSLESIYKNTGCPFELVYIDAKSPPALKKYLEQAAAERNFRLVRTEEFLSPNQARNLGLKEVGTPYVVFVDNDVEVAPGWLTRLLACAEETGAWAVMPMYFEGPIKDRIIHASGGVIEFEEVDGARTIRIEHELNGVHYDSVASTLERSPTGFCEFHCVLLPMTTFEKLGPLDEDCLSLHEHLDLSLMIRQAGGTIYVEPDAHVTYADGLLDKSDMEYVQLRWGDDWSERSNAHFLRKWDVDENSAWGARAMHFGKAHRMVLERMQRSPARLLKNAVKKALPKRAYAALRGLGR